MAKNQSILLAKNIRYLRQQLEPKCSQEALGNMLDATRSAISSYEDGRAEPKLELLIEMAKLFKVNVDDLLKIDFEKMADKLLLEKENTENYISGSNLRVLAITTDADENESIALVPQKAAAGYTLGYKDTEYIKDLPKYNLPFLPKNKTYRAFEISGDSMLPITSGSIVIGEYLTDWSGVRDGDLCIVATQRDGVVFKKVYNKIKESNTLLLKSTNLAYAPFEVMAEEVYEIWKFAAYIGKSFPEDTSLNPMGDMKEAIWKLQDEIRELKRKQGEELD
ncbi:LexA family transcriptional regulator [Limibacter armeniacum]|uniref:LexA family transcriptional regulator n=1 Tax=Limibacter armeniacum TaxID=466084 RepID=UPI002FE5A66F